MKSLTSINVQGDYQQAWEVYADDTREQSVGFVFETADAELLEDALTARQSQQPTPTRADCSVCVHGHDLGPLAGSPVYCTPQKNAHPSGYCCTGFRLVTAAELDERTEAIFGKPKGEANASSN